MYELTSDFVDSQRADSIVRETINLLGNPKSTIYAVANYYDVSKKFKKDSYVNVKDTR